MQLGRKVYEMNNAGTLLVLSHPGFYLIPGVGDLKTYSRLFTR